MLPDASGNLTTVQESRTLPALLIGRPPLDPNKYIPDILKNLELGVPIRQSAAAAGVNYSTFLRWRRAIPGLEDQIEEALSRFIRRGMAKIEAAADTSWQAMAWKLERRFPEEFSLRREIVVAGAHGAIHKSDMDRLLSDESGQLQLMDATAKILALLEDQSGDQSGTE